MTIEISVIVPFANTEQLIGSCVRSLLDQDFPTDRYEVIMVDNNSSDRSAQIVREHPKVRLVTESEQGSYAARNRGLTLARAPIVAFTDSDCVVESDWLSNISRALEPPEVGLVLGRRHYASGAGAHMAFLADYESEYAAFMCTATSAESYFGYTNNMGVKREIFEDLGPFDTLRRGADTLFVQRVAARRSCSAIVYSADLRVRHLEITQASHYYRKRFLYGKTFGRRTKWGHTNPHWMSLTDKLRMVVRVARASEGSPAGVARASEGSRGRFALGYPALLVGKVCFLCGCYYGRLS